MTDGLGRLVRVDEPDANGNLGDGTGRNCSSEIIYSPLGGVTKEKFGTDTALYNKLFYNSRGQLAEIRVGTYNATDGTSCNDFAFSPSRLAARE